MKRPRKKHYALTTIAIIIVVAVCQQFGWINTGQAAQTVSQAQPGLYAVSHFVDGDTIVVDMNGHDETIRMIGIDTPETHKPNTPVQCYGPAASAYTKNLIGNQKVRLESDPTNQNRDRYGRLLRYVYLPDGRMVEEELAKNGYAFAYRQFPAVHLKQLIQDEEDAHANFKGLWAHCTVTDSNGRKQTNAASANE